MNLDRLEQLARDATPGPWVQRRISGLPTRWIDQAQADGLCVATAVWRHWRDANTTEANAAYLAAASPDVVLKLIAVARCARDLREAQRPEGWREKPDGIPRFTNACRALDRALAALESVPTQEE